jgi:integrase
MPKIAKELSALAVKKLAGQPGRHPVGGAQGLRLQVTDRLSTTWILRIQSSDGRRRDFGLGGYPAVALAEARTKAREYRAAIELGNDPSVKRRRHEAREPAKKGITFREAMNTYINDVKGEWKSKVHLEQWISTLETYVLPVFKDELAKDKLARDVSRDDVMKVLQPIWTTKTETAERLRGRIERILGWAATKEHRTTPNPAAWHENLSFLLSKPSRIKKSQHHPALDYSRIAEFLGELCARPGVGARALQFQIQTASRSGEVFGATWNEIDLQAGVWTIPATRMKMKEEHQVPLNRIARRLIEDTRPEQRVGMLFPTASGKQLSNMAMISVIRRMQDDAVKAGITGYLDRRSGKLITPHGFRSTFRDWIGDETEYDGDLAEMALAHVVKNKAEAAYRRLRMLERRRVMMDDWANYCEGRSHKLKPERLTLA